MVPEGGVPMAVTRDEGRRRGEARRDEGVDRAAARRTWHIKRGTLVFLDAMLKRPDRTATTDDATDDLSQQYGDGGRWRGAIPKRFAAGGLIEQVGAIRSARPSRHAGLLSQWRAVDDDAIDRRRNELRHWLANNPHPPSEDGDGNQQELFPDPNKNEPGDATRWARN